jgi:hypothetical protein
METKIDYIQRRPNCCPGDDTGNIEGVDVRSRLKYQYGGSSHEMNFVQTGLANVKGLPVTYIRH